MEFKGFDENFSLGGKTAMVTGVGAGIGEAIALMFARKGADIVLVDGAVSRKTLAAPRVAESAVLCAGASYHVDMATVVADTAYACRLLTLPACGEDHPRRRALAGALTDAVAEKLAPLSGDEITVRDGSRLLLSQSIFEKLTARGVRFTVLEPMDVCCVCVNPRAVVGPGFDAGAFRAAMAAAVSVPVIDVREVSGDGSGG
jgi:hypothetical protein